MQAVSNEWIETHKRQVIPESFVEISLGVTDNDALYDAASSSNGQTSYSDISNIVESTTRQLDGSKAIHKYATLEQNLWILDGSLEIIPTSNYNNIGYASNVLSGTNGIFPVYPTITLTFSSVHTVELMGLEIQWGKVYSEYPIEFNVKIYNGATLVKTITKTDNHATFTQISESISGYDKIVLEIVKWCLPNRRARVEEIYIGIRQIYTKSNLISIGHTMSMCPITSELPIGDIDWEASNIDGAYNPYNTSGLSKHLAEQQEAIVKYGYKIGGGTEWINGGRFYLTEWNAPQNGITATFKAGGLLNFMSDTYYEGLYNASGVTLYSLAQTVLAKANLPTYGDGSLRYEIGEELKNYITVAPLPIATFAECLQLIANAAGAAIWYGRDGKLYIKKCSETPVNYEIALYNSYSKPEIELAKPLKQVDVSIYTYYAGDSGVELYNGKVSISGTETVILSYSRAATNVSATVTGGTLVSATYYTNACALKITGTGEVTVVITGNELLKSESVKTISNQSSGETVTIENELVTNNTIAMSVGNAAKNYYSERKKYSCNFRADPRTDVGDIVSVEYTNGSKSNVRLTELKYSYNGAFKGTAEGRVT